MITINLQSASRSELRRIRKLRAVRDWKNNYREQNGQSYGPAWRKTRLAADPEYRQRMNQQKREEYSRSFERHMLKNARYRAKSAEVPFELTIDDIVVPEFCPVLGIRLACGKGRSFDSSPSIDRIVPALGYVRGNIRVISHRANMIRTNASAAELRLVLAYAEGLENYFAASNCGGDK